MVFTGGAEFTGLTIGAATVDIGLFAVENPIITGGLGVGIFSADVAVDVEIGVGFVELIGR